MESPLFETFSRHYRDLYRFVYRLLGDGEQTEDVTQEAFLRLAREGASGDWGDEAARRWLFVVARNLCASRMREKRRRREVFIEDYDDLKSSAPGPAEMANTRERGEWVRRAVADLAPDIREGLDYAEIAEIVGCPLGTVKSRLARAREELRKRLKPLME